MIVLGKDTSWDFRNYHWYAPYAFLNHREALDVVVAHQASYYNPFLDIPYYWLAVHTHAWIALGVLGVVQGANVVPLYLIAREGLRIADREIGAGALALLGQAGALTLSMFGTTYYDNVMSVFVLSGLAILILNRETLRDGPAGARGCDRRPCGLHHRLRLRSQIAGDAVLHRLRRRPAGAGRQSQAARRCG